jgi:hypothetical protein
MRSTIVYTGVFVAAAAAAHVAVHGDGRSGDVEMKMPYELFYSVDMGEVETNQVTIRPDGVVTLAIAHSVPGSPVRAIGRYYQAVGPTDPELVAIGELIAARGLVTGKLNTTSAQFGGRYTLFVIESDGKEAKHVVDARSPLPEPLAALEERLNALTARVAIKAPQRAVSMQLHLDPAAIAPGDRVRVTLDVRNAGSFRTEIRNFAGFRRHGADTLKVNFWKPAATAGEPPEFAWSLDLTGNEWRIAERTAIRSKDPYVKLEGPGSLRAWTEIRFPKADPGPLLADLVYHAHAESEAEQSNDDLVVGFYRAEPVNVTILPRRAD